MEDLEKLIEIAKLSNVDIDETARYYGEVKALNEGKAYQRTVAWIYLKHNQRLYQKYSENEK